MLEEGRRRLEKKRERRYYMIVSKIEKDLERK